MASAGAEVVARTYGFVTVVTGDAVAAAALTRDLISALGAEA